LSDSLAFDPRYAPPAFVSGLEVDEFKLDSFPRADDLEPLPDPTVDLTPLVVLSELPLPDPFEEFQVDRRNISELLTPSLDGLFKPFDLTSERPMAGFEDLADFTTPHIFDYEDLDTRDQNVVRTMAQAEARSREMIRAAQAEGFALTEAARTEAQGLVAEAKARASAEAEVYADSLRREAEVAAEAAQAEAESQRGESENIKAAAEQDRAEAEAARAEAESRRGEAENIKATAEQDRAEAAAELAAVKDRIAGLDLERQEMEKAIESRRRELEAEYQGLCAELAAKREEVLAEARAAGQREGYDQGSAEGLAAGQAEGRAPWQEKTARLAELLERLENLYQDLWRANGPLMIQLAIEAAEGILNKELKSAEDLAVRSFEACIDFLGQANRVVFQARPQDIPLLEEAKAEQRQRLGALVKVTFQPDESLGPGDLIMESDVGRLDATIKHRAVQVMDVLRQAFESTQALGPRPAMDEPSPAEPSSQEAGEAGLETDEVGGEAGWADLATEQVFTGDQTADQETGEAGPDDQAAGQETGEAGPE